MDVKSQCDTQYLPQHAGIGRGGGVPKMLDLQLHPDHHEQQGEDYGDRQADVQVQQDRGHKGHQPD